jgi:hypothetical protein
VACGVAAGAGLRAGVSCRRPRFECDGSDAVSTYDAMVVIVGLPAVLVACATALVALWRAA